MQYIGSKNECLFVIKQSAPKYLRCHSLALSMHFADQRFVLEYEYICESDVYTSATCFKGESMYENNRSNGNVSRRKGNIRKQSGITESIRSLSHITEFVHQAMCEDDSYTRNMENDKAISLITDPQRQATIMNATDSITMGCYNGRMYMGADKANKYLHDAGGKGLLGNRKFGLRQSKIDVNQEEEKSVIDNENYVSQEEQIPYPTQSASTNADNVIYKHKWRHRSTNNKSKRNSYERLNNDTMEPRENVCPCKAHPRSAKPKNVILIRREMGQFRPHLSLRHQP